MTHLAPCSPCLDLYSCNYFLLRLKKKVEIAVMRNELAAQEAAAKTSSASRVAGEPVAWKARETKGQPTGEWFDKGKGRSKISELKKLTMPVGMMKDEAGVM